MVAAARCYLVRRWRERCPCEFQPWGFYMRDMNRDGTGDVDRESDAESSDSDGENDDRYED